MRARKSRLVATLVVSSNVAGAQVDVDGTILGTTPLEIDVSSREHAVGVIALGYLPARRTVRIAGGGRKEEVFQLEIANTGPVALLHVCGVLPGVRIAMDGAQLAVTPVQAPIAVKGGEHRIELSRPGYKTRLEPLQPVPGTEPMLKSDLEVAPDDGSPHGQVTLAIEPPGAEISIDGQPRGVYQGEPLRLAVGQHVLRVERGGYHIVDRPLSVREGIQGPIPIALWMTPQQRSEVAKRQQAWRLAGITTAITGALVAGGGTPAYLYYDAIHTQRRHDQDEVEASFVWMSRRECDFSMPVDQPACLAKRAAAKDAVARAARGRILGAVGLGIGAGAVVTGGLIALWTGRPVEEPSAPAVVPLLVPSGCGLTVLGFF
jgi:hypothetical protein